MWGYHDVTDPSDDAMEPPVCWITNAFDRSPAELVRVESTHPAWAPLRGSLLNLSYGNGKVFVVPHEVVGGRMQGGMCALPVPPSPTGIMRGRFSPADGQLYACGLFAWAGDRTQPGGFYRIRATGKPMFVPVGLHAPEGRPGDHVHRPARPQGRRLTRRTTRARTWSLKRTVNYGSDHIDERPARIAAAKVSDDGRTVFLEIPELRPTWCMEITYAIRGESGEPSRAPSTTRSTNWAIEDEERTTRPCNTLIENATILTPTSGFLAAGYTHTINVYQGCAFAGSLCGIYCYAQHNRWITKGRAWGLYGAKRQVREAYRRDYDRIKRPRRGEPGP